MGSLTCVEVELGCDKIMRPKSIQSKIMVVALLLVNIKYCSFLYLFIKCHLYLPCCFVLQLCPLSKSPILPNWAYLRKFACFLFPPGARNWFGSNKLSPGFATVTTKSGTVANKLEQQAHGSDLLTALIGARDTTSGERNRPGF